MLPQDFYWQHYIDGPGLYVDGRLVATITPTRNGVRLTTTPGDRPPWHHFMATEDGAKRYLEAWANKWTSKIRHHHPTPLGTLVGAPDPKAVEEAARCDWYRRRGRKPPAP